MNAHLRSALTAACLVGIGTVVSFCMPAIATGQIGASAGSYPSPNQADAPANPAASTSDTTYHVHGTVVNGMTNAPVGRALVFSMDRRLGTMTDGQGHFSIDVVVPPNTATGASTGFAFAGPENYGAGFSRAGNGVVLSAQKPGFANGRQPTFLPLDSSLETQSITLKLMPSASLSGHVSAANTDAAHNVHVTLLLHQVQDGAYTWLPAGSRQTDSHGSFRFADLRPGDYTVMTDEWQGDEPMLPQQFKRISREFPPDFLGDTAGIAGASVLHVRFGDTPQVQLHLRSANYYPISIPVSNQPPNAPIQVRVTDSGALGGFRLGYNLQTGAVEGALPNGSYTLLLASFGQQGGSTLVPITVNNAPLQTASVALASPGTIPIHVHTQFTGTGDTTYATVNVQGQYSGNPEPAPPVQLFLRPEEIGGAYSNSQHPQGAGPDELLLQNVQPGRYHIQATAMRGYVAGISSGGTNLFEHSLNVNAGGVADPIDVTVRDDTGTLNGNVTGAAGKLSQAIYVMVVPTDATGRMTQGFAGGDQRFAIKNVAPGSYRVLAARSSWNNIPFRDAEAMRRYDGKGTTVLILPGQTADITVPLQEDGEEDQ